MALIRFNKLPKHQRYEYRPRYWNPEKEELEDRIRAAEERKGGGKDAMKARISSGLRRGYQKDKRAQKQQVLRSNIILLAVIAFLAILSYLFLTIYLPKIVNAVESTG